MKRVIKKTIIFAIIILAGGYIIQSKYNSNIKEVKSITHESKEDDELVLVNRKYGLDKNHIPKGLSIPDIPFSDEAIDEEKHVAGIMKKPLEELVNEARKEGIYLFGNSGYRSYKSQVEIYNDRVKSEGRKLADAYVAKPGFSEHQTGLCMDITNRDKFFVEGTVEADWLEENCHRFGFIIRYPKGKKNVTGIEYEPWHIRYVGTEAAKYIYETGITLEEYYEINKL